MDGHHLNMMGARRPGGVEEAVEKASQQPDDFLPDPHASH